MKGEGGGCVDGVHQLDFHAILFGCGRIWVVLGLFGSGMLEFVKGIFDVAGHAEVTGMMGTVPFEVDAAEAFAFPVNVDLLIMVAEALDQMVGMLFANVFDTEVIDDKAEADWVPLVAPKARSVSYGGVTIVAQEMDELLFGEYARLWKAVHAVVYFSIDFAFVGNCVKIVKVDDFWRDEVDWDEHILVVVVHRCPKIIVLDVKAQPMGTWSRQGAVDEDLEGGHVGNFHAEVARVVNEVATNS